MLRSCDSDSDDKAQQRREEGCGVWCGVVCVHGRVVAGLIHILTVGVSRSTFYCKLNYHHLTTQKR